MRWVLLLAVISTAAWCAAAAQENNAVCTFADQTELSARYNAVSIKDNPKPQNGKTWAPGGKPILLFTQSPLTIANVDLAVGAYSVYLIPGREDWTMVVSKNVSGTGDYNEKDDLVRTRMEGTKLTAAADRLNISLGHVAPKQCELRVYYDKAAVWATVSEK
jgi:hypothetical protein